MISCVPHHPMGKAYPGYRNRLFQQETVNGINAIKVLTYITANEGFAKRTFNYVFYMIMATLIAPFAGKADVVVSTSPQFFNGLAGYFVSRLKRARWVLEIRDLWPESIIAVGALKHRRLIRLLERLEHFAYRKADHIVPVTRAFRDHIEATGVSRNKITIVRNGVDLELFQAKPRDNDYAESLGLKKNQFVAAYVGTHGMAHGLDTLLDAAEILRVRDDVILLMAGDGSERQRLQEEIKRRKLTNIRMLGQLPKSDMPLLWSVSDASLVLLRKLDLFLTVIPSKIFESMAMRKPIIMGVSGEGAEVVLAAKAGIAIEPENSTELAAAILHLADSATVCAELGNSGARYVNEHFNRARLADAYVEVLK